MLLRTVTRGLNSASKRLPTPRQTPKTVCLKETAGLSPHSGPIPILFTKYRRSTIRTVFGTKKSFLMAAHAVEDGHSWPQCGCHRHAARRSLKETAGLAPHSRPIFVLFTKYRRSSNRTVLGTKKHFFDGGAHCWGLAPHTGPIPVSLSSNRDFHFP